MPPISKEKREKISEQILNYLLAEFPKQLFTSKIAQEVARDEEFTKKLLLELKKRELVVQITKNSVGINYSLRSRWRVSNKAYEAFKKIRKN